MWPGTTPEKIIYVHHWAQVYQAYFGVSRFDLNFQRMGILLCCRRQVYKTSQEYLRRTIRTPTKTRVRVDFYAVLFNRAFNPTFFFFFFNETCNIITLCSLHSVAAFNNAKPKKNKINNNTQQNVMLLAYDIIIILCTVLCKGALVCVTTRNFSPFILQAFLNFESSTWLAYTSSFVPVEPHLCAHELFHVDRFPTS